MQCVTKAVHEKNQASRLGVAKSSFSIQHFDRKLEMSSACHSTSSRSDGSDRSNSLLHADVKRSTT